jgi:enoyl-CoA hydratase/carnithine racemase
MMRDVARASANTILLDIHDHVAVITLNRPEKRNAIDPSMAEALEAAIDRIEGDPNIRVGILRAEIAKGRPVFCAGHDLAHFRESFGTPEEDTVTTTTGGFAGIAQKTRRKPMIAAVDGLATSGGCEIALACDIIVASRRAAFALAEVKWNLVPTAGGAFRLPRMVGRNVAMDAILTAEPISALRAYQLGLVSRLTTSASLDALAMQLAIKIASQAPMAVRLARDIVDRSADLTDDEAWLALDDAARKVRNSRDLQEGLTAFWQKRSPRWLDR